MPEIDVSDLPPDIREKIDRVVALINEIDETPEERASTQAFASTAAFFHRCASLKP
jgi:hypothetical protein